MSIKRGIGTGTAPLGEQAFWTRPTKRAKIDGEAGLGASMIFWGDHMGHVQRGPQ